jgi:DNA-binding beta-propeller fold protein YncE
MPVPLRAWAAVSTLALVGWIAPRAAAQPALGFNGCIGATGAAVPGCVAGGPVGVAAAVAVWPDGSRVAVAGSRSSGVAVLARDAVSGRLQPLGCVSDNGTDGRDGTDGACADGDALQGPGGLVADGGRLYVAATRSGAVDVLGGASATSPVQCLKASPFDSRCAPEPALAGARGIALAPDGGYVYVAATSASAVVVLRRDAVSGRLDTAGCVSADGSDGHCTDVAALLSPTGLAVSPDGGSVYAVSAGSQAVASFARDAATGALRQIGCVMARPPARSACAGARSLGGAYALAVAPDGRDVYVAARTAGALTWLRRDSVSGALRFVGCRGRPTSHRGCDPDGGLGGARAIAIAPSGRAVVAASAEGLELFTRDPGSGALVRTACVRAGARRRSACVAVPAVAGARAIAFSPDGRDVYVAADAGIVAFRVGVSA